LYENPHVLKEVTWEKPQGMRPHHSYLRKSGSESMELPRFGGQ
jgi:hypothetical protein